jgi:hypothetical protein
MSFLGRSEVWVRLLRRRWARWSSFGRRLVVVRRYSSLGCTVGVGYGCGGDCDVVVVVPVMVVSAVVLVAVFFLVATCRFKDIGWPGLG